MITSIEACMLGQPGVGFWSFMLVPSPNIFIHPFTDLITMPKQIVPINARGIIMAKVFFWLPSSGEPPFWAPTDGFSPGAAVTSTLDKVLQKQKHYFTLLIMIKQTNRGGNMLQIIFNWTENWERKCSYKDYQKVSFQFHFFGLQTQSPTLDNASGLVCNCTPGVTRWGC